MPRFPPPAALLRITWTLVSAFAVESVVFGLSVLPAALVWQVTFRWPVPSDWLRIVILSMTFIPAYVVFACMLMVLSACAMRLVGWRTPADQALRIEDYPWPLMSWARYLGSIHLVRVFAGSIFRATPLWTWYLRLNGARIGRGVYVNSLAVTDHNLLEFGDRVVIGDDVHLSGHTVEHGLVKTAGVRLGSGVTVGLGTYVGIGVVAGDGCQIGAMSLVPKHARLDANAVYAGIPVRRIEADRANEHGVPTARAAEEIE